MGLDLFLLAGNHDPSALDACLTTLYHFLEPGGFLAIDREAQQDVSLDALKRCADRREADSAIANEGGLILQKEANVYVSRTIHVGNRSSIYDQQTCRAAVDAVFSRVSLPAPGKVLDVGVGDGRFSHFIAEHCDRSKLSYTGLEVGEASINPQWADLVQRTHFGANFFCLDPVEQYDAIFLFFVFHAVKHWPLFLYQGRRLLRPGGRLFLSNRTDAYVRWTHGDFRIEDEGGPPDNELYRQARSYWLKREACGVRRFDQIATITEPDACARAGVDLGFTVEAVIDVERQRDYFFHRRQLSPDPEGPAMWNVGRVGVTRGDCSKLSDAFTREDIETRLPENALISVLKK